MSMKEIRDLDYTILLRGKMKKTRAFYFPHEAWDDGPSVSGSAAVQLAFRVPLSAVEVCHAELVAKGVTIVRGATDLPEWRHRTLFLRDPQRQCDRDLR
jgi:hypothetical protein